MNRRRSDSNQKDSSSQAEEVESSRGRAGNGDPEKAGFPPDPSPEGSGATGNRETRTRVEVPLALVTPGQLVRITAIAGGRHLTMRLISMGLVPGAKVSVLQNSPYGPFIVALRGTRIVLGRGMAMQVRVSLDQDDGGNG